MVIPAIEMETSRGRLKNAAYLQCNYCLIRNEASVKVIGYHEADDS